MGLSSNVNLLSLTQKKTELTGKKAQNDNAIETQKPVVGVAQQTFDDTSNSLTHLKELLGKTPKDNPEYVSLQGEYDKETDETKKAELKTKLDKLPKENPEYKELLDGIQKLEQTKLPADGKVLNTEKGKEAGLEQTSGEIKADLETVEKEIEAEKKKLGSEDAKYEIVIGGADEKGQNRGTGGLTNEMYQMFEDMKEAGIVSDVDKFAEMSNSQKKALFEKLDTIQKETKQSTDYAKMKDGDKFTYSAEQMKELAKAAGYEVVPEKLEPLKMPELKAPKLDIPALDVKNIKIESPEQKKSNAAIAESTSKIKLPRGIEWQGENQGTSLEDFGITAKYQDGKVVYQSSTGQQFTEKEVNKYFRSLENNVDSGYSKLLDKAEKNGVDVKAVLASTESDKSEDVEKALKAAIKAKEIEDKAVVEKAKEAKEAKEAEKDLKNKDETPVSPSSAKKTSKQKEKTEGLSAKLDYEANTYGIETQGKTAEEVTKDIEIKKEQIQAECKKYENYNNLDSNDIFDKGSMESFERVVSNWKNEESSIIDAFGENMPVSGTYVKKTLPDGTKVYQKGSQYFALGENGYPNNKPMSDDEVKKHQQPQM